MSQAMQRVKASSSVITLNGWVAVASIAALIFLAIFAGRWAFRKYTGLDRPYTHLVSKSSELDDAPAPSRAARR